jgi:hypothetical protein
VQDVEDANVPDPEIVYKEHGYECCDGKKRLVDDRPGDDAHERVNCQARVWHVRQEDRTNCRVTERYDVQKK